MQGDSQEVLLRAATIVAGQAIVAAGAGAFQTYHLSAFLQHQAQKEAEQRQQEAGGNAEDGAGVASPPRAHIARGSTAY